MRVGLSPEALRTYCLFSDEDPSALLHSAQEIVSHELIYLPAEDKGPQEDDEDDPSS